MIAQRRPGGLTKLDATRGNRMVESMKAGAGAPYSMEFDNLADTGREVLDAFTDDELAELIAREPGSKHGHLAASILRNRDSWRTPARWALVVSVASFVVAIAAFARTM